jgi:hypothetical protein
MLAKILKKFGMEERKKTNFLGCNLPTFPFGIYFMIERHAYGTGSTMTVSRNYYSNVVYTPPAYIFDDTKPAVAELGY